MFSFKKIMIFNIFLYTLSFSEDIPNTLILDNPNKPITTVETIKKKEKAELNLNIKKVSSFEVDGYVNKNKKLISFVLDELITEDGFYLTNNKEIFNEHTRKVKDYSSSYAIEKTDYINKVITFKYNSLPQELYLIKYDSKTKELKKLYKWQEQYTRYIDSQKGNLVFSFTEEYKPFEIVNFSINRTINTKGNLEIKNGSYLRVDPLLTKEVIIKNSKGERIDTIALKNGSGFLKLDDSKKGIILENGSSILNFGVGFRNNEILFQIKGTTDSSKEYPMTFEVVNLDGTEEVYNINVKPAQYALKILNNSINLDFNKPDKYQSLNEAEETELISKSEILIDSKDLNIKVEFINNGVIRLKNGENSLNGKLEAQLDSNLSKGKIKTVQVTGKVKKEDVKNMPDGDYIGTTELIIIVDS
ncbi:MAG: hypothetical protein ACRDDH_16885 [Cetobacterium sp.]|uniref:hypothetical protein n=1 Tax=Cetobacterium sp. TaxID=2071632 RepID=UPI003EE56772